MNIFFLYSIYKWKLKYIEIVWKICYDVLDDLFCVKVALKFILDIFENGFI